MSEQPGPPEAQKHAGGALEPWDVGTLPPPPELEWNWKRLSAMVGPGILMAGVAIGAGEWLFGPAVSAQYGGTLLWLATLSILGQVFFNIEVMRYALYCGEPIVVGYFRTRPGPRLWLPLYLVLETCNIWPFMAANAAVPLAAALFGDLPNQDSIQTFMGITLSEAEWVKVLGYVLFLLAFLPLVFGGTIYRVIEKMMTFKVVVVLLVVATIAIFQVSWDNAVEVVSGFVRFGQVPDRAETIVAGPHFSLTSSGRDGVTYNLRGSLEPGQKEFLEFRVNGEKTATDELDPRAQKAHAELEARARLEAQPGKFLVEDVSGPRTLRLRGRVRDVLKKKRTEAAWVAESFDVVQGGVVKTYARLDLLPEEHRSTARELVAYQGLQRVGLTSYIREHGQLPDLNWAMIVAFAAIAGTGGLANTLASNYSRDKGWGMGRHVGAIPSAIGGHKVELSHVGMVQAVIDNVAKSRWRGWVRHIVRDQAGVWLVCCLLGMALPCMMSLEFIRNVPVEGNRAAAMTAVGLAEHLPNYRGLVWSFMLLVSFLVLAPNAVFTGEQISRRWTDVIWTTSKRARRLEGGQVRYIYYGILGTYGVWGLFALAFFDPLQIAVIGAVLQNVALGCAALHTLYVNRTLLPREMQPNVLMQCGLVFCSLFFLGISVLVIMTRVL